MEFAAHDLQVRLLGRPSLLNSAILRPAAPQVRVSKPQPTLTVNTAIQVPREVRCHLGGVSVGSIAVPQQARAHHCLLLLILSPSGALPFSSVEGRIETAANPDMLGSIDNHPDLTSFLSQQYTHLIIGGGTAGLVVAARLSENPDITVGVLEAGSAAFDDPKINVPGRFGETLGSDCDWQFESTPQPGLNGRSLPWPRGRVLGGTSALNFMTWNRGCREDYDAWKELGAEGWGWDGLL